MNLICHTFVFSIFLHCSLGQIENSTEPPKPCSLNFRKFASTMRMRRLREMARNFNVKWIGGNKVRRGFYDEAYNLQRQELDPLMNNVPCQWSCWGPWSTCTTSCGGDGVQERGRSVAIPAIGNGKQCLQSESKQLRKCGEQECPPPVDCQLSEWGNYSSCSTSCGPGIRSRSRHVLSEPMYGGVECSSFTLEEVEECPLKECPECPADWTRIGDDCYLKGKYSRTWHQAEEDCSLINPESHLVSLQSKQQALDLVNWDQFEHCIWLGARRNKTNDPFTWSDGTAFKFAMWHYAAGRSALRLDEACVLACTNDWESELSWTVQACDLRQSFVPTFCHISLLKLF